MYDTKGENHGVLHQSYCAKEQLGGEGMRIFKKLGLLFVVYGRCRNLIDINTG